MTTHLLAVINGVPTRVGTFGMDLTSASAAFMDKCARQGLHAKEQPHDVGSKELVYRLPMTAKLGLLLADLSTVELEKGQELPNVYILRDDGVLPGTYVKLQR